MTPEFICYTLGILGALVVGWIAGTAYGFAKGEAVGWQEGYFGRIAADKARRNANGTFKPKETP